MRPWRTLAACTRWARSRRSKAYLLRPPGCIVGGAQAIRQHNGVLHRQCAALRQVGQHGMRRIAEQGDAAAGPGRQRRQRVERPLAPRRYAAQDSTSGSDGRSRVARAAWPASASASHSRPCQVFARDHHHRDLAAAAHRIVHDVSLRVEPQTDRRNVPGGRLASPGSRCVSRWRRRTRAPACRGEIGEPSTTDRRPRSGLARSRLHRSDRWRSRPLSISR